MVRVKASLDIQADPEAVFSLARAPEAPIASSAALIAHGRELLRASSSARLDVAIAELEGAGRDRLAIVVPALGEPQPASEAIEAPTES